MNSIVKHIADYAIKAHADTNHYYDKYLPYEFHLRLVAKVANEWYDTCYPDKIKNYDHKHRNNIMAACFCHDLIEDARQSYNDVLKHSNEEVADIVFAVTNNAGKTRKDRANDAYYAKIRSTPDAIFVKLCDRIANVEYGILTKSKMVNVYKEEHAHFIAELSTNDTRYTPLIQYLNNLYK